MKILRKGITETIVKKVDITTYEGDAYLGIDAGSTTIKLIANYS
jgi:activator of 2-hydroxyglutaryl-CoA dehydratase